MSTRPLAAAAASATATVAACSKQTAPFRLGTARTGSPLAIGSCSFARNSSSKQLRCSKSQVKMTWSFSAVRTSVPVDNTWLHSSCCCCCSSAYTQRKSKTRGSCFGFMVSATCQQIPRDTKAVQRRSCNRLLSFHFECCSTIPLRRYIFWGSTASEPGHTGMQIGFPVLQVD